MIVRTALRLRTLLAGLVLASALGGCSVQLTAPYNADIEAEAAALQKDFFLFVANMQVEASTPAGYYANRVGDYSDFAARLAVIRFRAENDPGGVPCGKAVEAAERAGAAVMQRMDAMVRGMLQGARGTETCVTIVARLAEEQMETLRKIHELSCKPVNANGRDVPSRECQFVFSTPPLFDVINTRASKAPAVSAMAITLNELIRMEQMLRPAGRA